MGTYNQMVAESATKGESERTKAEVFRQRLDLFKELTKGESEPDGDAIARVGNRIGSEQCLRTEKLQAFVGIRMMCRLKLEGSDQIVEGLAAVVNGFYQGAKESLDMVELTR